MTDVERLLDTIEILEKKVRELEAERDELKKHVEWHEGQLRATQHWGKEAWDKVADLTTAAADSSAKLERLTQFVRDVSDKFRIDSHSAPGLRRMAAELLVSVEPVASASPVARGAQHPLAGQAGAPRWIASKEGLPAKGTAALVRRDDDGEIELLVCTLDLHHDASTRWYPARGEGSLKLDEVTHWMALPPDPQLMQLPASEEQEARCPLCKRPVTQVPGKCECGATFHIRQDEEQPPDERAGAEPRGEFGFMYSDRPLPDKAKP